MATGVSFTGLSSGVDTGSIVSQLVQLARVPVQEVQVRQEREKTRQQALQDIASRVSNLRTAAEALTNPSFWTGGPNGTSGDEASYTVTASATSAKASYQVQVMNLASADVHVQTASAGIRQFGALNAGSGVFAAGPTKLSALTSSTGTPLGLADGQTITLSGTKGGSLLTGTFTVGPNSTLDDLRTFVETTVPGSSVKLQTGGRITITSPTGTDQEVTDLSLSTGGAAPLFDSAFASSTQVRAASGIGTIQANDTLHITAGTLTFDVAVTAGMTMQQVAQAINTANGGVSAAVADGRLRVSGSGTGTAEQVTIGSTGSTAAQLNFANTVQANDAKVQIDGVTYSSATNESTEIIPGATLTLKRSSTEVTTATTDPTYVDRAEASKRAKALVDQYNSVVDLINTKSNEKKVISATTTADKLKGTLFASSTLTSMRSALRDAFANPIDGLVPGKNLGTAVGISTGAVGSGLNADALAGKLTFDQAKFEKLFTEDRDAARKLFDADGATTAGDGLATRIADLAKGFTKTGGLLQAAIDGAGSQVKRLQDQIDRMNLRVDAEEVRLKRQFSAMETAISQLQAAQSGAASLANMQAGSR
jgi:flagellar hook-associated protein 2